MKDPRRCGFWDLRGFNKSLVAPYTGGKAHEDLGRLYTPTVIAAWVFQLCGNGVAAASPAYGYNVRDGTSQGWRLASISLTFLHPAIALGKVAFTATLLRISSGRTTALLWFIVVVACAFGITITVTSWLTPCGRRIDDVITSICVPADTLIWLHVGLSAVVYIVRTVFSSYGLELERQGKDWTYGSVACYALIQAEICIYIAAQTMPLIRVMLQGRSSSIGAAGSKDATPSTSGLNKGKLPAVGPDNVQEARKNVELVQLPSGKIVPATSEEGKAFKLSEGPASQSRPAQPEEQTPATEPNQRTSGVTADDEVHRIWAEMGLSRRAWSRSPSPRPERNGELPSIENTATSA